MVVSIYKTVIYACVRIAVEIYIHRTSGDIFVSVRSDGGGGRQALIVVGAETRGQQSWFAAGK